MRKGCYVVSWGNNMVLSNSDVAFDTLSEAKAYMLSERLTCDESVTFRNSLSEIKAYDLWRNEWFGIPYIRANNETLSVSFVPNKRADDLNAEFFE